MIRHLPGIQLGVVPATHLVFLAETKKMAGAPMHDDDRPDGWLSVALQTSTRVSRHAVGRISRLTGRHAVGR